MPRLFTGIEIPPDIAQALALKRGALRGSRWIEPSDYHITLRFLGDVEIEVAEALHERLIEARARTPFPVTLDGLASFGGDKPRAILATVIPAPELVDLQAEQERLARQAGAEPERRKFTPHVTLARLRREARSEDVAAYLGERGLFEPLTFMAERVALFSARESKGGGPYVIEAAYPLG
ncbi:RNA 2',3'-cyclic phosphodiesterase [Methylobacterium sp. V23]|uniref:RNA 2',3'-cyclic phosphodiesterase n=1 Tax=Methylobacterium sp. V23 TaxID=2044878 RepID=UPI000CDA92C4|nr:RNA 2',3'-cyclic phosphodiesterase [Methylobacterium sp. V23]POR42727.1 RNA 2',3'-cyclic phosphodiesterase [Methylobacterium sp. V23]